MAIAIDFGTSNTVIARWNPVTQKSETVNIPGLSIQPHLNPPLIPSLVYVQEATLGRVLVGQQVREQDLDIKTDVRFFHNFKRGIGADIQGFLPELDGKVITFEQIGQWFLTQVIEQLATVEGGVDSLVLTVPVDSFEAYRHWLGKVCQRLPVQQVQMLDEPTAAALGYGLADQEILLVIDFGGGTLDLSLVTLDHPRGQTSTKPLGFILKWGHQSSGESSQQVKTARVLAKAGQNLGGSDIDNWLVDYFAQTQGVGINSLTTRLSERVKIQLSTQNQAREVFFDVKTDQSYELELNREMFDQILQEHGFFELLDNSMTSLLHQARSRGIEVADINAVLLVGGSAQLPPMQTWLKQYFAPEKIRCECPFEAIAQGALQLSQGVQLKDFLYHSYGIRYWDRHQQRYNWHQIIKAGQAYPMSQPVELVLGASVDEQPSIELIIGELGADTGSTEVYFDGDRLITRRVDTSTTNVQTLNDQDGARTIARLTPLGYPGSDRIKIWFQVDEQRFLRITVEDLLTKDTLLANQLVAQLR
jgi:molecular chaperone DnaK (HSP70)